MASQVDYAPPLRALGQALELLNLRTFEMELAGKDFLVRGQSLMPKIALSEQPDQDNPVRQVWGWTPEYLKTEALTPTRKRGSPTALELTYTPNDVDRFEKAGRAKRSDSAGMADAARLSQQLRTVGAYLTQKRARLVKISSNEQSVTVFYETAQGREAEETLSRSDLYDFWVRMYKKRAGLKDSSL